MSRMRHVAVAVGAGLALTIGAGCAPMPELPEEDLTRCEVERRTIETALEAWFISDGDGSYPATLDELVGTWVEPGFITFDWLYGSDGASYSMFGRC